ncbi:hypothetical protein BGZ83_012109 [Gryganskiella cystojenkinii]|nr:hypothetical protein BGZ83_012109 [Gryganskiella cystojenkinii]
MRHITASNPQLPQLKLQLPSVLLSQSSTPDSSASPSPRAVTASVKAPSTTATSTGSLIHQDGDKNEEDSTTLSQKAMTTITQEMMLSNLPAYSGIITRMNPFTRVAAWVDDLDDLQVPEEDLRFSHVRTALEKSLSTAHRHGAIENWDSESDTASSHQSEGHQETDQSQRLPLREPPTITKPFGSREGLAAVAAGNISGTATTVTRTNTLPGSDTIETLDDDFEFSDDFGTLRLNMQPHHYLLRRSSDTQGPTLSRKHSSLLQWQDSGSDIDDLDFGTPLDNHSLASSASFSRDSNADDENLLDGVIFPETMESLKLVTTRPYRPETEPSIFGKESYFQEEQDEFWEGLEIDGPDIFRRQGRNKNLRIQVMGRNRSGSRVQRQVVPLKDFYALPSKIPRLCRSPGRSSRPMTPVQSLSRKHSTHFDLTLRKVSSKSSLPRLKRSSLPPRDGKATVMSTSISDGTISCRSSALPTPLVSRASTPSVMQLSASRRNSLIMNKDEFPTFRSSSLAMRTVSFTEPRGALSLQNTPSLQPVTTKLPPTPRGVKSFASLRTLVKKLDLSRPKLPSRGVIPAFDAPEVVPETESPAEMISYAQVMAELTVDSKALPERPINSRSSSFTDWGSLLGSTENSKESRPSSRVGIPLGDISEISTADLDDSQSTVHSTDRLPRFFFFKRSPKNSMFSDGSELERFDNLPTYSTREQIYSEKQFQQVAVVLDNRRQSVDRVAAWLRKPQSIPNLREAQNRHVLSSEQEIVGSAPVQKSKSLRKSIFDIFMQNSDQAKEKKKKKQKSGAGPKLIRNLSESKVRRVADMVYNPNGKMWDGNDDALDHFADEDEEVEAVTMGALKHSGSSPIQSKYLTRRKQKHSGQPLDETWGDEPDVFAGLSDDSDHGETVGDDRPKDEGRDVVADCVKAVDEEQEEKDDQEGEAMAGSSLSKARGQRWTARPGFQRYSSHDLLSEEERLGPWAEAPRPPSSLINDATESPRPASMGLHSIVSKSSRRSLNGTQGGCSNVPMSGGGYSSRGEFEVGVEFDITTSFLEQCIATEAQHRMDAGKFFALPCGPANYCNGNEEEERKDGISQRDCRASNDNDDPFMAVLADQE